jgi:hypothetical protein
MIDNPVLLRKIGSEVYQLLIHEELLNSIPEIQTEDELVYIRLCDERLYDFWGYDAKDFSEYRYNDFSAETDKEAKEFASLARKICLALIEDGLPQTEYDNGLIAF